MAKPRPRILLGVTADRSLRLMSGFPEYLVEHGWDVHVVSSPGPGLESLRGLPGITAHAIVMARQPAPATDLRALFAWVRLMRLVQPDLISVGTPKAGLLGGIAGWLTRVPHRVYTLRGLRLETVTGLKRAMLVVLEWLAIATSHHVISVSKSLRRRAIELGLVRSDKIVVLGAGSSNGVDLATFERARFGDTELDLLKAKLGLVDGVPVVGFVGRLTEDKGLKVLAGARALLASDSVDYQLLIVGGIDDKSAESSLEQLRRSGRRAIETGHVESSAIYYQLMDILCLPTLREGFPNVVLEAGAAGIPTVTTDATGVVDSVVDGESGLVAEVSSSQSLAKHLKRLIVHEDLRAEIGEHATAFVTANYDRTLVWALTEQRYTATLLSRNILSERWS